MNFFTNDPNLIFFGCVCGRGVGGAGRGGGGGGASVSELFLLRSCGGGGWMDGQSYRPKPICLFNFFEVGDITMH